MKRQAKNWEKILQHMQKKKTKEAYPEHNRMQKQ